MNLITNEKPRSSLVGQRFGRLQVISVLGYTLPPCGKREWRYQCECDCGNGKIATAQNLNKGDTRSCGCLAKEHGSSLNLRHGHSHSPTYNSWSAMLARCHNHKHAAFNNYGGRGIIVCERWRLFDNFLSDMGKRPDGTTIDRIDVNGNYDLRNCRWATKEQQAQNTRRTLRVIYQGVEMGFAVAARKAGIKLPAAKSQLWRGWAVEKIIPGATLLQENTDADAIRA